jgi:hypothetical protein
MASILKQLAIGPACTLQNLAAPLAYLGMDHELQRSLTLPIGLAALGLDLVMMSGTTDHIVAPSRSYV